MVVYADVLIFLNTIINFYLLLLCSKIGRNNESILRIVCGAFIGALFSLYIFLPNQTIISEAAVRIVCSALIILISFGYRNIKNYLKNVFIFYAVSFTFAGAMLGIWLIFKPGGMVIHNSIVYFNFSPLLLIILSVIFYFLAVIFRRIFSNKLSEKRICSIKIYLNDKYIQTLALIDSGHNVTDFLSDKDIIFLSKSKAFELFGSIDPLNLNDEYKKRYRLIPCQTVSSDGMLTAMRCDTAILTYKKEQFVVKSPIVAATQTNLNSDYGAIINPALIERS